MTYFITKGIDINSTDKKGINILMLYLRRASATEEGLKLLIQLGININHTSREGCNALMWYFTFLSNGILKPSICKVMIEAGIYVNCNSIDQNNAVSLLLKRVGN